MFGSARIRPLPVRCLAALVWLCACGKDARAQQPPVDVKVEFVRFDRPGVSSLFCNIHPQMSAVVVTVDTPYYGVSDAEGRISIHEVPDGRYQLQVWSERSTPDSLKLAERVITISATTRDFGPIRILENPEFTLAHKNKYGQDYVLPSNPDYLPH